MTNLCIVDNCNDNRFGHGYCNKHYKRYRKTGDPLGSTRVTGRPPCSVEGCDRPNRAKGLCNMHYGRMRLYGEVGSADTKLGKGCVTPQGYRILFKNGKHVFEHRWVMQQHLGRELLPSENVHHINGDKLDNQLSNLELWSTSQPSGQRIEDKTRWAIEWLEQYAPETLNQKRD